MLGALLVGETCVVSGESSAGLFPNRTVQIQLLGARVCDFIRRRDASRLCAARSSAGRFRSYYLLAF